MGDFLEFDTCERYVLAWVVSNVKVFDEAKEMATSSLTQEYHPIDNETEDC